MNNQLRQGYDVDQRRAGMSTASDNTVAKQFLRQFAALKRADRPDIEQERKSDDRFFMFGEGTFKNQFRAR